ncbi:MAG: N-acetyltransferase [Gammaproteobacteria bacterium]|nr:N-acetyltransferase [Gammaproteobacteria bacterium]NNM01664.1 N-acetyltransferase [Gammaproteobacteria bacterium]
MNVQIRQASAADAQPIGALVRAAFGSKEGPEIAALVEDLRADPSAQPVLSLVAESGQELVGHILFSRVSIPEARAPIVAAILAPLSVHPDHQHQGIGGNLIGEGLQRLEAAGVDLVFVLGHPGYYPRYGFSAAGSKGFDAPYPIPAENADAWMYLHLGEGLADGLTGRVACADALDDPGYWRE